MPINNKRDLMKLWRYFFGHLHEASTYCELFFCFILSKSRVHLDEQTANHNIDIMKKYNYFFIPLEHGIAYAMVLSITQLFAKKGESKKEQTLAYFVDEAKKFKINRTNEFSTLKKKHMETLEKLEDARNNYFAHRKKEITETLIPPSDAISNLLNDTAGFLNLISGDFDNGGIYEDWKKQEVGWSVKTRVDFQRVLDNLYRGESARLAEIDV